MRLAFNRAPLLVVLGWSFLAFAQPSGSSGPSPQDPAAVIQFLSQTIEWHRQLAEEQQLAKESADLAFLQENHGIADQVLQLAFEYARGQAQLQAKQPAPKLQAQAASTSGDVWYFFGARIIPGDGSPAMENMSFIVTGGKFTQIGSYKDIMPPKPPSICRRASSYWRCEGRPG